MDAQELFGTKIPAAIAKFPDKAKEINAIYYFNITGDGGGEWTVNLSPTGPSVAVGRARRGDVPDWGAYSTWFRSSTGSRARRRSPFTSANGAQTWFEWRRHGWSLPAMVGLLLPFELGLLFVPVVVTPPFLYSTLLAVLLTPPVMAGFVAATLRKANPHARDWSGLTPLDATRPFTTAAMVGAKLGAALWSTLAAWLLVSVAVPPALMLADAWDIVIERLDTITAHIGLLRAMVIALLVGVGLVASTWKRLVQSLYIGLAGRRWITTTSGSAVLVFVMAAGPAIEWIWGSTAAQRALWECWTWILAGLVAFKMAAAAWVAVLLCRSRLLSDRELGRRLAEEARRDVEAYTWETRANAILSFASAPSALHAPNDGPSQKMRG